MPDDRNNKDKIEVRPVLILDGKTLDKLSGSFGRLLVGLSSEGYQPAIVCPPGSESHHLPGTSAEFLPYPMLGFPLFYRQNREIVLDKVSQFKPTVLHCMSPGRARLTRMLAEQLNVPYVVTFDNLTTLFWPSLSDSHCMSLIAPSVTIAEKLRKKYKRFAEKIMRVNVGVFVEDSCACFANPGRLAGLVVAQHVEDVMYLEPLLNAIRHLAIDGYEFVVALIGVGSASRHLPQMLHTLGLSQIVTVVDRIDPLRDVFAGADIFVQPRQGGSLNMNLLEAVSVGTAVATCRENADDFLVDGQTAVFFDPNDDLSIYSSLQKLLDQHEFSRRIAMAGQDYMRKHHSVSRMTEQLIWTYQAAQANFVSTEDRG